MNIYIVNRADRCWYDECVEKTIIAENEKRALQLANLSEGQWKIRKKVDLTREQVLTCEFMDNY